MNKIVFFSALLFFNVNIFSMNGYPTIIRIGEAIFYHDLDSRRKSRSTDLAFSIYKSSYATDEMNKESELASIEKIRIDKRGNKSWGLYAKRCPNKKFVAAIDMDGPAVTIFKCDGGGPVKAVTEKFYGYFSCLFSPDSRFCALLSTCLRLSIIEVDTGRWVRKENLSEQNGCVFSFHFGLDNVIFTLYTPSFFRYSFVTFLALSSLNSYFKIVSLTPQISLLRFCS